MSQPGERRPLPPSPSRETGRMSRRATIVRALGGERPGVALVCFASPTLLAILRDFVLRGRSLVAFEAFQWLNYAGSSLASAGFWGGPLWLASYLFASNRGAARWGLLGFFALFVFP